MKNLLSRKLPLLALTLVAAACSDTMDPVERAPEPTPGPAPLAVVSCNADLKTGAVTCGAPNTGGASAAVLIGGQSQYVRLTSSDVAVTADTFAFNLTVTNLIAQPLGTTDFTTLHPKGVRVFFLSGPTSTSGGSVTVANADGVAAFTAPGQPYYVYGLILPTGSTSPGRRWKLRFTPEVTSFTFTLAVSTEVPWPDGYILGNPYVLTLDPGETRALPGTVYSFVGNPLPGEAITFTSSAPAVVSVSGTQATAGASRGFAEITAVSGPRPAGYVTAVSVCQSTVVAGGHASSQSIASTDCFSAFGSTEFRPSNQFYGDLFRVSLAAGQTITVTMNTGNILDSFLVLADPTGLPVALNDDDSFGEGSRIVFTARVSGVYVFEASTYNALDTGNYTLNVAIS
jgi:hypothetical protein